MPRFHFCSHLGALPERSEVTDLSIAVVKLTISIGPILQGFGF